jgi:hypothetical protein
LLLTSLLWEASLGIAGGSLFLVNIEVSIVIITKIYLKMAEFIRLGANQFLVIWSGCVVIVTTAQIY